MPELVTVAFAREATEAQLYRSALEQAGIDVYIADDGIVTMNWLLGVAVGGIKVQVEAAQAEEARAILEIEAQPTDAAEAAQLVSVPGGCPNCGSVESREHWQNKKRNALLSIASFFLLPLPVPFRQKRLQCTRCERIYTKQS